MCGFNFFQCYFKVCHLWDCWFSKLSVHCSFSHSSALFLSPAVRYLVDTNAVDPTVIPVSGPKDRLLKG